MVAAGYERLSKKFAPFDAFYELANGSYSEMIAWTKAPAQHYLYTWQYVSAKRIADKKLQELQSKKK